MVSSLILDYSGHLRVSLLGIDLLNCGHRTWSFSCLSISKLFTLLSHQQTLCGICKYTNVFKLALSLTSNYTFGNLTTSFEMVNKMWYWWLYQNIQLFVAYISREHWHFVSINDVQYTVYAYMVGFILTCGSCLFVCTLHYLIITIKHIHLRHYTSKMLVRYMLSYVCLRSSQLSQLSFIQYMGLCVFRLPSSLVILFNNPLPLAKLHFV